MCPRVPQSHWRLKGSRANTRASPEGEKPEGPVSLPTLSHTLRVQCRPPCPTSAEKSRRAGKPTQTTPTNSCQHRASAAQRCRAQKPRQTTPHSTIPQAQQASDGGAGLTAHKSAPASTSPNIAGGKTLWEKTAAGSAAARPGIDTLPPRLLVYAWMLQASSGQLPNARHYRLRQGQPTLSLGRA
jgi:hypothetical protein